MIGVRRWSLLVAAAGVAIFALSFVPAWIVHERVVTGEGYRDVFVELSAWRDVAVPVVTAAALLALVVGLAGAVRALRPERIPGWLLIVGSVLVLGLLVASMLPVWQVGHASRVTLTPGWALIVAIGLGVVMLAAAVAPARPSGRVAIASVLLVLLVVAGGSIGRVIGLNLDEGDGRFWEAGSYTRPATGEEPAETISLDGSTYRVGDRWAGAFEWSGWTVVFDNDPACPDSRGSYHAHPAADAGIYFVRIVDTCLDGERGRDLETGIWARD
ncbi:MAG: hypothetical protein ABI534_01990 [Chloroflexota bacterium]